MSFHIISIDEPDCSITCANGQLIMKSNKGTQTVPMEDVAAIIITSFKCTISNHFLIEACKQKVGLIICEAFKPVAIVLPADRVTDTLIIRNLARMPEQLKQRLWQKTVDAKCHNQAILAREWDAQHQKLDALESAARSAKDFKEAQCAKLFWEIFADSHQESDFKRGRSEGGANALFNYAYAVLLSCVLQRLLALGLDPSFGIFHLPRAHAAPLAYDIMEPFRPAFDANVSRWIRQLREAGSAEDEIWSITRAYRQHIIATLHARVEYEGKEMHLKSVIELVISSFRIAVQQNRTSPYQAWTISIIKWVG